MARTVKDAAFILSVIAGRDEYDEYTNLIPFNTIPNYAASCTSTSLHGLRIGIPRNAFPDTDKVVMEAFSQGIKILQENGATIIDADFTGIPEFETWGERTQDLVLYTDFKDTITSYLSSLTQNPENLHSVQDLISWTHSHAEECWPEHDTVTFEPSQGCDSEGEEYREVLRRQ
jgi:amidase